MTTSETSIIQSNSPDSLAKKINIFFDHLSPKTILFIISIFILYNVGNGRYLFTFIHFQNLIFICISIVVIYFYLKKKFNNDTKNSILKNEIQSKVNILDKLCDNTDSYNKNKTVCDNYKKANLNYKSISDLLISNVKE